MVVEAPVKEQVTTAAHYAATVRDTAKDLQWVKHLQELEDSLRTVQQFNNVYRKKKKAVQKVANVKQIERGLLIQNEHYREKLILRAVNKFSHVAKDYIDYTHKSITIVTQNLVTVEQFRATLIKMVVHYLKAIITVNNKKRFVPPLQSIQIFNRSVRRMFGQIEDDDAANVLMCTNEEIRHRMAHQGAIFYHKAAVNVSARFRTEHSAIRKISKHLTRILPLVSKLDDQIKKNDLQLGFLEDLRGALRLARRIERALEAFRDAAQNMIQSIGEDYVSTIGQLTTYYNHISSEPVVPEGLKKEFSQLLRSDTYTEGKLAEKLWNWEVKQNAQAVTYVQELDGTLTAVVNLLVRNVEQNDNPQGATRIAIQRAK